MEPTLVRESVASQAPGSVGASDAKLLAHLFSSEECEALTRRAEGEGFAVTAHDYPPDYRNNDRRVFDDPALAQWLFTRVRAKLPPFIAGRRGPLALLGLNPRFRACRYRDGQSFTVHQDGAYAPSARARSQLTLQISLSEPEAFSGGRTRFYEARGGRLIGAALPSRGSALLFPHDAWHDGEPVTHGTKVVLRTDVLYEADDDGDALAPGVLGGHRGYVFDALPLPDGIVVTAGRDKLVRVFAANGDAAASDATFACRAAIAGHTASVTCLGLAGGRLFSGSRDRTVRAVDVARGISEVVRTVSGTVLGISATPDGEWVAALATGELESEHGPRVKAHDGWAWSVAVLEDGTRVSVGEDGALVWTRERGGVLTRRDLGRAARALAVLGDGRVVVGFADGSLAWLAATPTEDPSDRWIHAHAHAVTRLAVLDRGGRGESLAIASASEDGFVRLWDIDGRPLGESQRAGIVRSVRALGSARRGEVLVAEDDGYARVLQLRVPAT
ncbi:MAG: 2OG-Fe(II) oxygenase [Polyangiaceae bacterium]